MGRGTASPAGCCSTSRSRCRRRSCDAESGHGIARSGPRHINEHVFGVSGEHEHRETGAGTDRGRRGGHNRATRTAKTAGTEAYAREEAEEAEEEEEEEEGHLCWIAMPPLESTMVRLSKRMSDIRVSVFDPNLIACELDRTVVFRTVRPCSGPPSLAALGQMP